MREDEEWWKDLLICSLWTRLSSGPERLGGTQITWMTFQVGATGNHRGRVACDDS